jgi:hypothetical protein
MLPNSVEAPGVRADARDKLPGRSANLERRSEIFAVNGGVFVLTAVLNQTNHFEKGYPHKATILGQSSVFYLFTGA